MSHVFGTKKLNPQLYMPNAKSRTAIMQVKIYVCGAALWSHFLKKELCIKSDSCSFKRVNKVISMRININCERRNLIYVICLSCKDKYIGDALAFW